MIDIYNVLLRSILEAITEFLPISSTGHLFLFSYFYPFQTGSLATPEFEDLFDIFIQTGAILSVIVLYFKRFVSPLEQGMDSMLRFYTPILLGSLPILVLGFLFKGVLDQIKSSGFLLMILGTTWFIGGVVILFSEKNIPPSTKNEHVSTQDAIKVGLFQVLALMPGVSRSLATITGARLMGYSYRSSIEFSFFLAVPALVSAGLYKLFKYRSIINSENLPYLSMGFVLSFVFCIFVIRYFLKLVENFGLSVFGYYRVLLSLSVFLYIYLH
jgi:undecaprenyl-diphosphatase